MHKDLPGHFENKYVREELFELKFKQFIKRNGETETGRNGDSVFPRFPGSPSLRFNCLKRVTLEMDISAKSKITTY